MKNSTPPKPYEIIDEDSPIDLAKLFKILLKYKWVIIATTVIVPILLTFYALRLPKTYRSTATLEYDPNPSRPLGAKIEEVADHRSYYMTDRLEL